MLRDAPGLPGGSSRWLLETSNRTVKMPPPCAVESHVPCCPLQGYAVSSKREPPRAKPVACAPESTHDQRGASPLQVYALRPETECNCVAKRRGGEQQEVNDQSVG